MYAFCLHAFCCYDQRTCSRRAFGLQYTHHASQLAEKMGRMRDKEVARREAFQKAVQRVLPASLLSRMGLLDSPPHCQVQVPPSDTRLPAVSLEDVQDKSIQQESCKETSKETSKETLFKGASKETSKGASTPQEDEAYTDPQALQLENAALKAELAHLVAIEPLRGAGGAAADMVASVASMVHSGSVAASMLAQQPLAGSPAEEAPWRHAMSLKDEYIDKLRGQLQEVARRCSAYEGRVQALEQQLRLQGGGEVVEGASCPEVVELVAAVLAAVIRSEGG